MHDVQAGSARIPAIGLGTWTLRGAECEALVAHAVASGYRHIDTAAFYENERAVGEGLRASGAARESVFVTTKIWHTETAPDRARASALASLERLGLDQVDLLLIHWPPSDGTPIERAVEGLARLAEEGLARHVGVSNFTTALLARALAASPVPLVCNQCEYHPLLDQDAVLAACRAAGMAFTSYSPLHRGGPLLREPAVTAPATRLGRSPAQVVLRWHIQQPGVVAIPRSSDRARIAQNLAVGDFELTAQEMAAISALRHRNERLCDYSFSPDWDTAS